MNATSAISVEALSKRYQINRAGGGYQTFREAVMEAASLPLRKIMGRQSTPQTEDFWALRDVNVEVKPGEVVGVVGRNGAGKSTFLKILSRITKPTTGQVRLVGRVGSLLEVGTGFHPELSGRENIFLNGAILGMSRHDIATKFDAIVEFAEIGEFLDTPVKRYSSGMYVRLAFAVAAHLQPEILLVDEVLSVGDAAFQRKCMGKMGQVASEGRTILFVSHNMGAITRLCEKAIWFDGGRLREFGDAQGIVTRYLASGSEESGQVTFGGDGEKPPGSEYVVLEATRILGHQGNVTAALDVRHPFTVEVQYRIVKQARNLRIGIRILAHDGAVLLSSTDMDQEEEMIRDPGVYVSRCTVPGELLNYGEYFVAVGCDTPLVQSHFYVDPALGFRVEQTGGVGGHINDGRTGLFRLRLPWKVERAGA